jgi:sugar lactone lactonase YvrE
MDADGTLYLCDVDRSRLLKVGPKGRMETVLADPRLAGVGALWIDDDGALLMPAGGTVWSYALGVQPLRR